MNKLTDWMWDEDIWNFLDKYSGADEGRGEYIGPAFEREWIVTPATYTRGMIRASEDINELKETYDEYERIPVTQICGTWVVTTLNERLQSVHRVEDEEGPIE